MSELVILKDTILTTKESFERIAASDINFQKEMNFAIQLLEANSFLMSTAVKNKESLKNAMVNISAIGLSLNPATKLAYLVPRGGKVCLDISYMGLSKLATDSGSILWVQAQIVREKDTFNFNGVGQRPDHGFNPFAKDRGEVTGAYCVAKTIDGEFLTEVMSLDELLDIRDRTEAYKAYAEKKTKSCPWISDETEMMKKTVIKRAYKLWPKSDRLNNAIDLLNQTEGIDFGKSNSPRDVTPPENTQMDLLIEKLRGVDDGEARLLKHLSQKDKLQVESLDELSSKQVEYSINFLKQFEKKSEATA